MDELSLNFIKIRQRLPNAKQSFVGLRQEGKVYVDKTEFVYKIAVYDFPQIITRPRRFGKSTLQSTLEELFLHGIAPYDGHDSYFKGLAIEQLWQDTGHYLVLRLDFQEINLRSKTIAQFELKLQDALVSFCHANEITVPEHARDVWVLFNEMLKQLQNRSLVLLVDEYDVPLLSHVEDEHELAESKDMIRSLFGSIKIHSDKLRCVLFTGVTRYQDLELGTAANSFTDLTHEPSMAACCGYTRAELKQYFADHLRQAAAIRLGCALDAVSDTQIEDLLDELSTWYDGYSFDGSQQDEVFSTWSILLFFASDRAILKPYWSANEGVGYPKLLKVTLERVDMLQLLQEVARGDVVVDSDQFMQSSLANPDANPYALMFQAGYLTLTHPFINDDDVHLACPNLEIARAFANLVYSFLCKKQNKLYTPAYIEQKVELLASLQPAQIQEHFNSLFNALSYDHYPIKSESMVQALIIFHLFGLGLKPRSEVMSSTGRADCVFDIPEHQLTIVFELKYEESSDPQVLDTRLTEALNQISGRKYALNASSQRTVARFGLVFCADKEVRNLARVGLLDIVDRYAVCKAQIEG